MLDKSFNPKEAEARIYDMWESSGAFKPRMDTSREAYSIVIPPPNVTGSLHMGHAVNNTLQDILIRFERMRGKDVLWQPGTDHAGIATQMVVERKLAAEGNLGRKGMTRDEFLAKVWEWKHESGGNISQQLRRLGASCDWSREKFTLGNPEDPTDKMAEAVTKAFVEMYEAGLIYRDKRLVNWDPHFQTAISDLEVENREKDGHFWHFKYPLDGSETYEYVEKDEDGNVTLRETRDYISIATTRPETMLGDGAVAVHPDDERYAPIVGKMVRLPLTGRLIPIITDEYPDMDFGSGAVKITGAHDFNDYEVAKRNDIPMYSLMDEQARMCESEIMPEKYVGMDRFKARKEVVADIDAEGLLLAVEDKKVMQPFGDRSGVVIEPMLTDQWYVDAKSLAKDAIDAVDDGKTSFVPATWKKTYDNWMHDIQPWCISRQLWWGHRIPAWILGGSMGTGGWTGHETVDQKAEVKEHDALFEVLLRSPIVTENPDKVAQLLEEVLMKAELVKSVEAIRREESGAFLAEFTSVSGFKFEFSYFQDSDVLDTWFSSGLWPFSTLGWPDETPELARFYPGNVLVTAFDIIFFWVARMMMQGLHFMGEVPFKDIYIHAIVRDEEGKKMSKSEGNVIDPVDLIDGIGIDELVAKRTTGLRQPKKAPKVEKATRKLYPDGFEPYGADALRFTLAAMAAAGRDIKLSVKRVEGYRNFGTKLWNVASFALMNECRIRPDFDPASCTQSVNQWAIGEAVKTSKQVTENIEKYRFNDAADAIYKFAWNSYAAWYIELIKPIMNGSDEAAKEETKAAAGWILDQVLKLLHPFMPFITEELWAKTADSRETQLILAEWPELPESLINKNASADIDALIRMITEIRSVRSEMNIPPSKKGAVILIDAPDDMKSRMDTYAPAIEILARVNGWSEGDAAPQGSLQTIVDGVTLALPLDDLIDKTAERARLAKEIEKTQGEIERIDKKLSNANFVDRAPEAVVAEQHSRRAAFASELEKLAEAMENLG
ncbi:MAG: valine--tRNA ligase [Alphaproteobacteria bacterium]